MQPNRSLGATPAPTLTPEAPHSPASGAQAVAAEAASPRAQLARTRSPSPAARVAHWVQKQHARLKLNPAERAEQDALDAVAKNSPKADALVQAAIQKMFEHSQKLRYSDAPDHEVELQWLQRCVDLYGKRNDTSDCGKASELMGQVTERGLLLHENRTFHPGVFFDGEAYLQTVFWRRFCDFPEGRLFGEDEALHPIFIIDSLRNVKPETAEKFLSDPRYADRHVPPSYRDTLLAELRRQTDGIDRSTARFVRKGTNPRDDSQIIPPALRPKLEGDKAVYDEQGHLVQIEVPTPDVVLQEIAGFLMPQTPEEPSR